MIHFPHAQPQSYAQRSEFQTTYSFSSSQQVSENGSTASVSVSLHTSYYRSETVYTPSQSPAPVTYSPPANPPLQAPAEAPADRAENNSTSTQGSGETQSVVSPDMAANRNSSANTILAFIEQRLATDVADGADLEALQSRLQAGLEGFMTGYQEAYEQLQAMGLMEGDVQSAVEQTFNQVLAGVAELAEKFGLEDPTKDIQTFEQPAAAEPDAIEPSVVSTAEAPKDFFKPILAEAKNQEVQNLQSLIQPTQDFYSNLDAEKSESRFYNFQLRTTDGDVVTIRSYADQGERYQANGEGENRFSQYDSDSLQDFRFSVQGELDGDELSAITDLLSQLNDVADEFFQGDISDAYTKALEVGYNDEEIAQFSLNLSQTQYQRIEQSYGKVARSNADNMAMGSREPATAPFDHNANRVARMSEFVRHLQDMFNNPRFEFARPQFPQLAEFVGAPRFAQHPNFHNFQPFVANMTGAFNRT